MTTKLNVPAAVVRARHNPQTQHSRDVLALAALVEELVTQCPHDSSCEYRRREREEDCTCVLQKARDAGIEVKE